MLEAAMQGFLYPNEIEVHWSVMIVLYPYITGLVAGAFIVSSLYHVFGRQELKPIGRFALVGAFCFLIFACTPLLFHLGHPERAFNIMITPKFTSAIAGFGFIYTFYMIILIMEIWFVFRPSIVRMVADSSGFKKFFYSVLALGVCNISEETLKLDHKITTFLAAIGIPSACVLHGYVGFLFGSLKSNPWWSTPLMPVIFLLSAIVSGIAVLIVLYAIVARFRKRPMDNQCMQSLCKYLWGFFIIDFTLELLEILTMGYEGHESWMIISQLITEKLGFSYITVQLVICSGIPLVLLSIVCLVKLSESTRNSLAIISSVLLLIQVLAMRWNVVIGGQLFSKSLRGFTSYHPTFFGREGLLLALTLFAMPFVLMYIFNRILPCFEGES